MHVISRKTLLDAATNHPPLATALDAWYRTCKRAAWTSLADVRQTLPSADAASKYTVFNIQGNHFRLIVEINYRTQRIYIRQLLAHTDI